MQNTIKKSAAKYPTGWFAIAFSEDVKAGEIKRLFYFGRELVLFRTERGAVSLVDAYCPHMGAHLGVGGLVDGETIRCPFHGWKYRINGECASAPFKENAPDVRLETFEIVEQNQVILVWHDHENRAPMWRVPIHPEPDSSMLSKNFALEKVSAQVRDVFENIVDLDHFHAVHGTNQLVADNVYIDPAYPQCLYVLASTRAGASEHGSLDFKMDAALFGPGHGRAVGEAWGFPDYRAYNTFYATPVDEHSIDIRSVCRVLADDAGISLNSQLAEIVNMASNNVRLQLEADILIWANKKKDVPGEAASMDRYISMFRSWYSQFYVS